MTIHIRTSEIGTQKPFEFFTCRYKILNEYCVVKKWVLKISDVQILLSFQRCGKSTGSSDRFIY